ncbi:glycosyltransferase family 1 protein [Dysgonomonas sp. 520]|uniref:glycosyltransferase family 4 protein n=1 Tax=Dysgonomonas sp. 520 TaxID=2302931 RepID=UPI0013D4F65E|nr:glycosyltransferase family 1 protein [Dysgonomonas sp. 520]NDW09804.1 glycosyltransferase family 1 protein [Dysgonomonas sp. 520]
MKILYDHQIFQYQRVGGVSRYFTEIIKHLPTDVEADVSVEYSFNEYLKNSDIPFQYVYQMVDKFLPQYSFKGQGYLTGKIERYFPQKYNKRYDANKQKSIQKIKEGNFDIFHPTFFDDYYLDVIENKPFVLTVHDMVLELYPELTYSVGFIKRKRKLVERATHIIAVSENTKTDLVNVFDVDPDKISVTHHASSLIEGEVEKIDLPQRYLLYVGDRRMGYKNFNFLVTSLIPLFNQYPDIVLLCVGSEFNYDERYFLNELGVTDKVKYISVSDNELYTVYDRAEAFIYPSYYEGFGIPVLEAFQAKCPVVLAETACAKEVAGDAALYFQPKSPNQLRTNVISLLNDETLKTEYIRRGTEQLKKYSWQKSAQSTVDIYKKILESR